MCIVIVKFGLPIINNGTTIDNRKPDFEKVYRGPYHYIEYGYILEPRSIRNFIEKAKSRINVKEVRVYEYSDYNVERS